MTKYGIKTVNGHILIETESGLLLIDTGSPASLHEDGTLNLCGIQNPVLLSLASVDASYISQHVGAEVKGLIGMDLIRRYGMGIDVAAGIITIGEDSEGWAEVPSRYLQGCPSVQMEIRGKKADVILDTGAPVSYIASGYTEGLPLADTVSDFSPLLGGGSFSVNRYDTEASFAGTSFAIRLGNLPGPLASALKRAGIDGAFGIDALKHFKVMFSKDKMWVR